LQPLENIRFHWIYRILFLRNYLKNKKKDIGRKRRERKERKRREGRKRPHLKSFMSIQNTTFKYKEYKMEVDGAHNDVMVVVNANEKIEIIEC